MGREVGADLRRDEVSGQLSRSASGPWIDIAFDRQPFQ